MRIGTFQLNNRLFLAPMAGITDKPFRMICKRFGASLAVSEMIYADDYLNHSSKALLRVDHEGELGPIVMQIAGSTEQQLVDLASLCVERGAQIIDINMGCPAKKICRASSGSALMRNEQLVAKLLNAVVKSVDIPVTLKTRLGWKDDQINIMNIARIAQDNGIAALALHGRTREQMYSGDVDYKAIAEVKSAIDIPVIANGDIDSPEKASWVFQNTGVDAIMIGRAACGNPWLFTQIDKFLSNGTLIDKPSTKQIGFVLLEYLDSLYDFYGEHRACRIARKHIGWFTKGLLGADAFRKYVYQLNTASEQKLAVQKYFI